MDGSLPPSPNIIDKHLPDWYVDLQDDLDFLKHYLQCEVYDPTNKDNPWRQVGEPILNEKGLGMFIGYLQMTAMNKNLIMANIPNYSIAMKIARDVAFGANLMLITNRISYGIAAKDIPTLNTLTRNIVRASVLRAFMEGERNRVKDMVRQAITTETPAYPNQQRNNSGILSSLFGGE